MGQFENETPGTASTECVVGMSNPDRRVEADGPSEGVTATSLKVLRKAMLRPGQELTDRESLILNALLKLPDAQLAALVRLACAR